MPHSQGANVTLAAQQTDLTQRSPGRSARRRRLFVGGLIIAAVVSWLLYQNIRSASTYYMTVGDIQAAGPTPRLVRISGTVAPGSIAWMAEQLNLSFMIQDETGQMPVIYHGVRPDMFQDEAQAVVEGRLASDGVFRAQALVLKCPSKYEEKK